jgi:hypothetical protein
MHYAKQKCTWFVHLSKANTSSAARDTRREGMLVGGTNKKKTVRYELDVTARDDTVSSDCSM